MKHGLGTNLIMVKYSADTGYLAACPRCDLRYAEDPKYIGRSRDIEIKYCCECELKSNPLIVARQVKRNPH